MDTKILAIDDNRDNLATLKAVARDVLPGCALLTVLNGPDGIELARTEDPDVILLDIVMPGMDGFEVCRRLKADEGLRDIPVVFLTAIKTDRESRIKALDAGAEAFLSKPLDEQELVAQVRAMTRLKAASRGKRLTNEHLAELVAERTGQLELELAERKPAEDALWESEDQFRAMFQMASVGIAQADVRTGQFLLVNHRVCQITGYSAAELLTLRVSELTHPEDRAHDWEAFQRVVRGEDPEYRLEKRYVRKDGTVVWVNVNMTVICDAEGRPVRTIATIEDVAERKRVETQTRDLLADVDTARRVLLSVVEDEKRAQTALSQLNAELEQRVLDRTAELSAANQELDSFAYAVSHDLRAPLRAMSGFSVAILEDFGASLPDKARGFLSEIRLASQNMGQLIDGLLALSRSTRGELQRDRIDLSAMAERLCQELARTEPTRTVDWRVEPRLTAWGDARMIEVVMRNLLGNAWKYTAGCAAPSVRVHAERKGGRLMYCVTDNGAGFDMRHADRLFKPFQRLHRQDEFPGIGIGLATVRRVVHRHGGTLSATAAVGQGATFRFHLPYATEGEGSAPMSHP